MRKESAKPLSSFLPFLLLSLLGVALLLLALPLSPMNRYGALPKQIAKYVETTGDLPKSLAAFREWAESTDHKIPKNISSVTFNWGMTLAEYRDENSRFILLVNDGTKLGDLLDSNLRERLRALELLPPE